MSLLLLLLGGPFCVKLLRANYLVCHDVSLLVSLLGAPCNIITFVTTWCSMLLSSSYVWATWWAILCDHLFHYLVRHVVSLLCEPYGFTTFVTTWCTTLCHYLMSYVVSSSYHCASWCTILCDYLCHCLVRHVVSLLCEPYCVTTCTTTCFAIMCHYFSHYLLRHCVKFLLPSYQVPLLVSEMPNFMPIKY